MLGIIYRSMLGIIHPGIGSFFGLYANGVKPHSPGSRRMPRTLGSDQIESGTLKGFNPSRGVEPLQGSCHVMDDNPGCARRARDPGLWGLTPLALGKRTGIRLDLG
jgi:hypothetical protein